jgi:alpha-tubulin suppressor-like RCC1 family protein
MSWGGDQSRGRLLTRDVGIEYVQVATGLFVLAARARCGQIQLHYVSIPTSGRHIAPVSYRRSEGFKFFGFHEVAPELPAGTVFTDVAAGNSAFVALRDDGNVFVRGLGALADCDVPPLPECLTYTAVAADGQHGLALRSDGMAVAWGMDIGGTSVVPPLDPGLTYVQIAAGSGHSLALRSDGAVIAWGSDQIGQCDVPDLPPGIRYTSIFAAALHSVARRSDGSVVAWGSNIYGETDIPALPEGHVFRDFSLSFGRTVAIIGPEK